MATDPQAAPEQGGGEGGGPAQQAIQQIQEGFMSLGKLIQQAGQNLPPQDVKMFQQAAQAADAMIQSLTGGGDEPGDGAAPKQSGPMPPNANAKAQVAPNQG